METIARNSLAVLIETRGNPTNWTDYELDETNIYSLGIADDSLVLNENKIISLSSADYSTAKTILGILGPNYEFTLAIDAWNGSSYANNYTVGLSPNASASEIVKVERFALLNNVWTKATMRLWKSCEDVTC